MLLEKPPIPLPKPGQILAHFGGTYAAAAVVAFLFSSTGPIAVMLAVGARGGLSQSDLASWVFAGYFLNGLISIALSWVYRQPLVFLWSIPGAVLLGPALGRLTFPEVVGAFVATGVLMLLLGLSGWVRRAMEAVPMPVVMAMVAGVFLRFGVDLVIAHRDELRIALPMTAAYFVLSAVPRMGRVLPPLIGALIAGALAVWVSGSFRPGEGALFGFAQPNFYMPRFSVAAMVELVIPLAISVLVVQNGQGVAVLAASGHRAPINAITATCGVGAILTGFFGAVSTCLTGPVNAVLASAGDKDRQYSAAIFFSLLAVAFGLLAPFFTRLLFGTPPAFIATLAGLAMLRVLQTAFALSFGGRFSFGALVCFLVTVADIALFRIGAPFWGLVFGVAVSRFLEREDFRRVDRTNP
jgi:benzoate membrane transport protein